jgi:bacteriorhodopsin
VAALVYIWNTKVDTASFARRLEVVSSREQAEMAILKEASDVSVLFSGVFFFFLGVIICSDSIATDLHLVQRSILKKRLEFSLAVCLYICFFSCLFNFVQYGDDDDIALESYDNRDVPVLDLARPIEWILTCPLMQLCIPIIGGENVKDYRRTSMPLNAVVNLCFGLCAMFSQDLYQKLTFYLCGVSCFLVLCYQMNCCIMESSGGAESMFWGSSVVRKLVLITASTWVPFPIWYALSPEGFNIIPNAAAMKIAVAFLNVFSKGVFIFYLSRVNADMKMREQAMSEFEVVAEIEGKKDKLKGLGEDFADFSSKEITSRLACVIEEILTSMGRGKDYNGIKEVFETHMINTTDDVMVLTQKYCEGIALPWGFVVSCKQKIKSSKHQVDDVWGFPKEENARSVYQDGGPLPPQVANDPRKLREHHRRNSTGVAGSAGEDDDFDNVSVGGESARTARTALTSVSRRPPVQHQPDKSAEKPLSAADKDAMQAAISSSQNAVLEEIRQLRKQQMEQYHHVNAVEQHLNKDIENIGQKLEGAMSKVMTVIDKRLESPASPRQGAYSSPMKSNR